MALEYNIGDDYVLEIYGDGVHVRFPKDPATGLPWASLEAAEAYALAFIGQYQRAQAPAPLPVIRVVTKLAFRRKFPMAERIAFDNFAANTNLTDEQKATLQTIAKDFELAGEIDMDDPDTASGLAYLESCGIIAAGRAAEILA